MIGRWHNVHTDTGHDSRVSFHVYPYTRIYVYIYICTWIYVWTKRRMCWILLNRSSRRDWPFPIFSPVFLFRSSSGISRGSPLNRSNALQSHRLEAKGTRNFYTRVAVRRLISNRFPHPLLGLSADQDSVEQFVRFFLYGHLFRLPGTGSCR